MSNPIRTSAHEQTKTMRENLAKELWLLYFNNTLYVQGIITEKQRNQMKNKITALYHTPRGGSRS